MSKCIKGGRDIGGGVLSFLVREMDMENGRMNWRISSAINYQHQKEHIPFPMSFAFHGGRYFFYTYIHIHI